MVASLVLSLAQDSLGQAGGGSDSILALDPRWTLAFDTPPVAPAGFDQEAAYIPLDGGRLMAIDLDRGRVRWQIALATSATPATGDGMVFVAADAHVIALDQRSGRSLWRTPLPGALAGPIYWDSGWVFVSAASGDVIAIRAEDGHVVWRHALGSPLAVRPSLAGDRVYVALADHRLAALTLETGAVLWSLALEAEVTGLLALEEQLLAGTRANRLHSISLDRARIRWTQRAGADVIGAPAADDEHIYFVAFDNVLRALNRGNGNLRWTRNLPSRPSGGALRADDVVLVPFSTAVIGAFLAKTGEPSFTIRAAGELGGAPFLRDSARPTATRLVATSREGDLQGFAARFELPPVALAELPGAPVGH
ncbi:MAG TPA: PQQ-binding-like beta-propeller repeat protein [Vicinamibacterales bacterium]|nr:PQQ-binding-like beta-propeller repeat protein [Vicinamibacterales bacterium]